jgi:hypothetical protein
MTATKFKPFKSKSKLKLNLLYNWQSVNMSRYWVLLWDLRPDSISCRNVAVWNLRSCICVDSFFYNVYVSLSGVYFLQCFEYQVICYMHHPCVIRFYLFHVYGISLMCLDAYCYSDVYIFCCHCWISWEECFIWHNGVSVKKADCFIVSVLMNEWPHSKV